MKWPFLLCRDACQTGGATVKEKDPTVVECCSYRKPRFLEEKREMAEEVVALKEMYNEEEVRKIYGFKISSDGYAEVTCGCPSYCLKCKAKYQVCEMQGTFYDNKILHISEVDIRETKMIGDSPLIIIGMVLVTWIRKKSRNRVVN
ncbi:hypothetical protein HanLR1_Chr10g0362551 [Helianthus annuus]|uniref:Uncharacterized protein n=1 Tax=Helianthus annuus TaxID=4232 RepID=A0A251TLP8_HELAN|nr:hypothetical protein HanHA89_Chr10g0385011 [Helianthus annuus]KAJ0696894.1 hypothetical protein HanLR1_Chr10g0362551 [Helianthus annuus]